MDPVFAAAVPADLVQHRQERREPGATGQEQHRPLDRAQVETAERAVELDRVAFGRPLAQVPRQRPGVGVAQQEVHLVGARTGAERVRAGLVGAGTWRLTYWPGRKPSSDRLSTVMENPVVVSDTRSMALTRPVYVDTPVLAASEVVKIRSTQSDCGVIWQVRT